ncbi:MAG: hypothetical protein ACI96M_003565 [Candidatus Azotimanducaceae bacterium]|jgi:hypothetical protein
MLGMVLDNKLEENSSMSYHIEHLKYDTYLVTNVWGRCFEGTLLHCEEYVEASKSAEVFMPGGYIATNIE